jgi:hypothetical protein
LTTTTMTTTTTTTTTAFNAEASTLFEYDCIYSAGHNASAFVCEQDVRTVQKCCWYFVVEISRMNEAHII